MRATKTGAATKSNAFCAHEKERAYGLVFFVIAEYLDIIGLPSRVEVDVDPEGVGLNWRKAVWRLEGEIDATMEDVHLKRFEALRGSLIAAGGPIDPAKNRSRLDAIKGTIHSFPYMLWTVRRQLWREKAFQYELGAFGAGMTLGLLRGFGSTQWIWLGAFSVAAVLAEANNTAAEMKLRSIQQKLLGGTTLDVDIGDMFEFAALPVAMCAWPWGIMWVKFMISPG